MKFKKEDIKVGAVFKFNCDDDNVTVTRIDKNNVIFDDGNSPIDFMLSEMEDGYCELIRKANGKAKKVNFLLKYDLDEDPIEEFETMKEVDERIKELVEEEDSLQKESIIIYEIKAKHEVKVETKITKKLIK